MTEASHSDEPNLGKALAAFEGDLDAWNGVPAIENIADALSIVKAHFIATTGEDRSPEYRNYLGEVMRGPEPDLQLTGSAFIAGVGVFSH